MDNLREQVISTPDQARWFESIAPNVGSERQLLFDDFFIHGGGNPSQYPYNIRWVNGPVEKHGAPIFEGEQPWEASSAWLSVMKDSGVYRMWYNSHHEGRLGHVISYAESDDGLHFARRKLGVVEHMGSTDNNIVFDGGFNGVSPEMGNVFIDPHAPEGERYKMIFTDWEGEHCFSFRSHENGLPFTNWVGMLRGAGSPDGLHWKRYYENFAGRYFDSQNAACWDETLGKFVAYHREGGQFGGLDAGDVRIAPIGNARAVGRLESDDYRHWFPTGVALQSDFLDTRNVDIYNSAYSRYPYAPLAHFMFPSYFYHYEGTFEVKVCTSRDNITWSRPTRETFIPLSAPDEFDCYIISVAPGFVPIDDDHLALYYRSGNGPHGGAAVKLTDEQRKKVASRVSRVVMKRDRIVGIEAGDDVGHFAMRPIRFAGRNLVLNVEPIGPGAEMRVALLGAEDAQPIDGYTLDDCVPLTDDDLDAHVKWRGKDAIESDVSSRLISMHFRFRNMRIYAFQFTP